ncbi:hypothetical protein jhhlp_005361 [Lomentospora prolificans]|uniref:Integral membrane protein n=1 Tax=Lomentospora prolificans TaxID=41688 RepID=A0A2N3N6N6_9PEZI|nr:hypothetical protein jhhlp_005361 [Lomentospora prolificans]
MSKSSSALKVLSFFSLYGAAKAQSVAISSTAAWSSQIVAFWGAVVIAMRGSSRGKTNNPVSSIVFLARTVFRANRIYDVILRENWLLHSGWENGPFRTEIAVITWRTPDELRKLARRAAALIDVFGDAWEVLILGHKIPNDARQEGYIHWIKSPKSDEVAMTRFKEDGSPANPLQLADISIAIEMLASGGKIHADEVARDLLDRIDNRATRTTLASEIPSVLSGRSEGHPSWSRIFTLVGHTESPFLRLRPWTGQFALSRGSEMDCAIRMYILALLTVSCAVGLMGAAAGRGLAVWIIAIYPTLGTFGAQNIQGSDALPSLIALDKSSWHYETSDGSLLQAGDMMSPGMTSWQLLAALVPALSASLLIVAGWAYGSLHAERYGPSGIVGHGMLWLSITVAVSLSIRAMISIKKRGSARLIGRFREMYYDRIVVGQKHTEIPISKIIDSPRYGRSIIGLAAKMLRECTSTDIGIVKCVLRLPEAGKCIDEFVVSEIIKYQYEGDSIVAAGDSEVAVAVTESRIYPWVQGFTCIALTMACAVVSATYAYYPLPFWVKMAAEAVTAASAVWFSTLERTGGLYHTRDAFVCFMAATMVVSSVWYVGVRDVG